MAQTLRRHTLGHQKTSRENAEYTAYSGDVAAWAQWLDGSEPSEPVRGLISRIGACTHVGNAELFGFLSSVHETRRDLGEPGVRHALDALHAQYLATTGHPDKAEAEWEYTIRRVLGTDWSPQPVGPSSAEFLAGLNAPTSTPDPVPEREASTWEPEDIEDVLDGTYRPVEPAYLFRTDGVPLFYPARVNELHGESESGKSWIAVLACVQAIQAGKLVLYVDYESDRNEVISRMLRIGATPDQIRACVRYVRPDSAPGEEMNQDAFSGLVNSQPALVIFDGVTEAFSQSGARSREEDDVVKWMRMVPKSFSKYAGSAVVLIDHVAKTAGMNSRFAIGSQAKLAAVDGASYLVDVDKTLGRGMVGQLNVYVAKDRGGYVRPKSGPANAARLQLAATFILDSTDPYRSHARLEPYDAIREVSKAASHAVNIRANVEGLLRSAGRYPSKSSILAAYKSEHGIDLRDAALSEALSELEGMRVVKASLGLRGAIVYEYVSAED